MKRLIGVALVLGLVGVAAACDDSPTDPSELVTFTATLLPANEVPPVTGPEAAGTGTVTISLNVNRDSGGAITSATADFQVNLSTFPANTALTLAHIHRGVSGTAPANNIVVNTGLASGEVTLTTGTGTFSKTGVAVTASLASEFITNPAGFYFNVHSQLNGPGMARGQLVRQ